MAFPRPVVWEIADVPTLIRYLCNDPIVTVTLVVCCSKEALIRSLQTSSDSDILPVTSDGGSKSCPSHRLARPTLQLLSTSKSVKLVFCPDTTHLRAYLATFPRALSSRLEGIQGQGDNLRVPVLAILNLVQLHRDTSAFSAQGINRTIANAVDASFNTKSRLILVECPVESSIPDDVPRDVQAEADRSGEQTVSILWDERVSVLNVTTKSFGVGGRGWQGRTISLRSIAERWCDFTKQAPDRSC